jgi:protein PsiE
MLQKKPTNWREWVVEILHIPTTGMLICIALFFAVLIFKNFYITVLLVLHEEPHPKEIIENVFIIFLQIEIIAAIKIYFDQNFHFPLKFFLYIGITDIIRQIIIQLDDAKSVLMFSIALVIAVLALTILELKNNWIQRHKTEEDEHFEL